VRAFLLAAGKGTRFRPVTERIPKPLFPFLNVPLARAHLVRLRKAGIREAGVNLHHLGGEIRRELEHGAADLPELRFFEEPRILGTAGALRNARDFLDGSDFLVVNADAAIEPDFEKLLAAHRKSGRPATLLVVENREPDHYTPLQAEGDRIVGFGGRPEKPLLYTGICVLSPALLARIPPGETALVGDLWRPLLDAGEIGRVDHEGPFHDLGVPGDFLGASLEALSRGAPFPAASGTFDPAGRVLSAPGAALVGTLEDCVVGRARIGRGAILASTVAWDGVEIGEGARLTRCLAAGGRVPPGAVHADALLWPGADGIACPHPLDPSQRLHRESPRR